MRIVFGVHLLHLIIIYYLLQIFIYVSIQKRVIGCVVADQIDKVSSYHIVGFSRYLNSVNA